MPIKPMIKAGGTGQFYEGSKVVIRMVYRGCTNRKFFHIMAQEHGRMAKEDVIEQLGTFDPMLNERGEKYVALNIERITYWLSEGATATSSVRTVLGLAGILPITPSTYVHAWRGRKLLAEKLELEAANAGKPKESES